MVDSLVLGAMREDTPLLDFPAGVAATELHAVAILDLLLLVAAAVDLSIATG